MHLLQPILLSSPVVLLPEEEFWHHVDGYLQLKGDVISHLNIPFWLGLHVPEQYRGGS